MMKVEFNRAALAEALSLVGSVVPARTPKPILRCVQLSAGKEEVRISATDLEVGINCLVSEVSVQQAGETVVPADRLSAIVRESSDDVLVLEAAEGRCEIKGSDSHFTIYGQEADQYPSVPEFDGEADLEIGGLHGSLEHDGGAQLHVQANPVRARGAAAEHEENDCGPGQEHTASCSW